MVTVHRAGSVTTATDNPFHPDAGAHDLFAAIRLPENTDIASVLEKLADENVNNGLCNWLIIDPELAIKTDVLSIEEFNVLVDRVPA